MENGYQQTYQPIRFEENTAGTFGVVLGGDVTDGSNGYSGHTYISSGMQANTWYHVALVWDSGANNVIGYLNGTQVFNESNTTWTTSFTNVVIGAGFLGRFWNGKMDDVHIYNRALSASEISTLAQ